MLRVTHHECMKSHWNTYDDIMFSADAQFRGADIRTQKAIFAVLSELVIVKQGALESYFPQLIPHIADALEATGNIWAQCHTVYISYHVLAVIGHAVMYVEYDGWHHIYIYDEQENLLKLM